MTKKKSNLNEIISSIKYLYMLAIKYPEKDKFIKRLIKRAQNAQLKLGKLKRTICFNCNKVLILGRNLNISYIKRENGKGLLRKCLQCKEEKFFIFRNKK